MTPSGAARLGAGLLAALLGGPYAKAEGPVQLCGQSAPSVSELYLAVAKQPAAHLLRADADETVLQDDGTGGLWIFVVHPVTAVLCRLPDKSIETQCDGERGVCESVLSALKARPYLRP